MITYVDSAEAVEDTSATTVSVTVPAAASANNLAILMYVNGDTGLTHTLGASGWTQHINADGGGSSTLTTIVWSKLLTSGDLNSSLTITSNNAGVTKRTLDIAIYSGAEMGNVAQVFELVSTSLHSAPTVATIDANAWIVQFVADRGSPGSVAFNPPGSVTQRQAYAHSGGAAPTSMLTDEAAVGTGTNGGGTYQGTISTQNASLITLALEPNSNLLTANAGTDASAQVNSSATLSGSATGGTGSYTYQWIQIAGTPSVTINNDTSAVANFTTPSSPAVLIFELTVDDGVGSAVDTVTITIVSLVRHAAIGGSWTTRLRRHANGTWQ